MLREQACRYDDLVVVLFAMAPVEQVVDRERRLIGLVAGGDPDLEFVEFRAQVFAL